jgi:endonuclease YncB( thermonuclease family)
MIAPEGRMARARSNALRSPLRRRRRKRISSIMLMLPLATVAAVIVWEGPPPVLGVEVDAPAPTSSDPEAAYFARCSGPVRTDCVVDGDTFWYAGEKIRIADINTPEVSRPECRREAELGEAATTRLRALLNAGPFTLEPADEDRDRYGRLLRVVTRDGESLGTELVREGLAEEWQGHRGRWC